MFRTFKIQISIKDPKNHLEYSLIDLLINPILQLIYQSLSDEIVSFVVRSVIFRINNFYSEGFVSLRENFVDGRKVTVPHNKPFELTT